MSDTSQQQQRQVPDTLPITVILTVLQWRMVLGQLAEGPYKMVGSLIAEIEKQASQGIQTKMRMNGEAHEELPQ